MLPKKSRIVIVGGGFAGLRVIRNLAKLDVEITLIDRHNYHTFVPLLYQVATGFIPPETIAYPMRKYVRSFKNTRFIPAEVQRVDFVAKTVQLTMTTDKAASSDPLDKPKVMNLAYDYLVLATGSKARFLGVDGASEYALPMRTLNDAMAIRDRLIGNFEQAAVCLDPERKTQLLTIAIVGGGATGVELAGSIIELIQDTLAKDFSTIDLKEVRVILLHSGERLLADYPAQLSDYAAKQLRHRGVKVHFQSRVSKVMAGAIELDDGTMLKTTTVIWTAGVEAEYPQPAREISTAKKDKICVNSNLQLPDYPEVYAVGDLAFVEQDGEPLLGIAPEALQQGVAVGRNLQRQIKGMSPKPFDYFNKGKAAIIARNSGVAYLFGKIPLKGWFAWLLWLGIHLYYLPGIANRCFVFVSWIRDYVTKQRSFRQLFKYRQISQSSKIQLAKNFQAIVNPKQP